MLWLEVNQLLKKAGQLKEYWKSLVLIEEEVEYWNAIESLYKLLHSYNHAMSIKIVKLIQCGKFDADKSLKTIANESGVSFSINRVYQLW